LIATLPAGFHLDMDSTVICREGQQEGERKGYNPRRKSQTSARLDSGFFADDFLAFLELPFKFHSSYC